MTFTSVPAIFPKQPAASGKTGFDLHDIVRYVPPVQPKLAGSGVIEIFNRDPSLSAIPVMEDGEVLGLLTRQRVFLNFARQFGHAVFARRPASRLMIADPLVVDAATTLDELRHRVVNEAPNALDDGFVVRDGREYLGVGTSLGILRLGMAQAETRAEELARAKRAAEDADAAKSRFLANMSHELRTPLNAIIGFSEIIASETLGVHTSSAYKEYAEDINSSGRLLLDIINDILDMSIIEAGHFKLSLEDMDVARVLHDTVRLFRDRAQRKGISMIVDVPGADTAVHADSRAVRQILINLLSNAVKFSDHGSEIVIRARHDGTMMRVCVCDQGIGIPADKIDKVLEPFIQVENEMTRKQQGTGLGLPIVASLAERMNADFRLESSEGKGTTAILALPLAGAAGA